MMGFMLKGKVSALCIYNKNLTAGQPSRDILYASGGDYTVCKMVSDKIVQYFNVSCNISIQYSYNYSLSRFPI